VEDFINIMRKDLYLTGFGLEEREVKRLRMAEARVWVRSLSFSV
jgi:hypothetical protein